MAALTMEDRLPNLYSPLDGNAFIDEGNESYYIERSGVKLKETVDSNILSVMNDIPEDLANFSFGMEDYPEISDDFFIVQEKLQGQLKKLYKWNYENCSWEKIK